MFPPDIHHETSEATAPAGNRVIPKHFVIASTLQSPTPTHFSRWGHPGETCRPIVPTHTNRSSIVQVESNTDDATITRNLGWFGLVVLGIAMGIYTLANSIA